MAWVDLSTISAGVKLTAARLNEIIDNMGVLGGAWTAYTPVLTAWTLGNGIVGGRYRQVGKTVDFAISLTVGSTTVISGSPTFTLPTSVLGNFTVSAFLRDVSPANEWLAWVRLASGTANVWAIGANGARAALSTTFPFTWAAGDLIYINGTYEAA